MPAFIAACVPAHIGPARPATCPRSTST